MIKDYKDPGYFIDCIVFHDGTNWRAAIDVEGTGNLTDFKPMTNYKTELQYSKFCNDSLLSYSVNIFDHGETLSIVALGAGSHGTHVAAITAAYLPEQPELNGVAPGAQIISLKIGDHRLGSDEVGQSLVRALTELTRLDVDLANMSYGEPFTFYNVGRFNDLLKECINKTGVVFCTSAGNSGPAMNTVGAPGGSTEGVISVGAFVDPTLMESSHSMLENVNQQPYTWSSRGPVSSGHVGYHVYAPGILI